MHTLTYLSLHFNRRQLSFEPEGYLCGMSCAVGKYESLKVAVQGASLQK